MRQIENWFTIEPTKGYVKKSDYEIIKNLLKDKERFYIIKKQRFILVIVIDYNMSCKEIFDILKYKKFSKVYEIGKIANNERFINTGIKLTLGMPY